MRFLHISDLHFGIENRNEFKETSKTIRKNYMDTLTEQIKGIVAKQPVDFILLTGDVAWKAAEDEYEEAKEWLTCLLETCGLKSDRLYICPGNHDINRKNVDEILYPESQEKAREFLCVERIHSRLEKRFQEFCQFSRAMGVPQYKIGSVTNNLVGVHEEKDYRIVCINTAWYALNDKVQDRMWVGDSFVEVMKNDLKSAKKKPTITIMHHPKTSWNENERNYYENTRNVYAGICEFSDIVLTGHTHETYLSSENFGNAFVTSAGAAYQGDFYQNNFCVYDIDWTGVQDKASRNIWQYHNPKWLQDTEYIGERLYKFRKNREIRMKKTRIEPGTVTTSEVKRNNSCISEIDEISSYYLDKIVKDIQDDPEKITALETVMTAFVFTSAGKAANLNEITESILNKTVAKVGLLINGFQGTGKSTFLSLLYLRLKTAYLLGETNRVPVFIDLHKLDGKTLEQATEKINEDLKVVEGLLEEGFSFYLIFDGCDNYIRVHYELEERIQEFIAGHNEKFILCIGDIDEKNPAYDKNFRTPVWKEIGHCSINLRTRGYQYRRGLSLETLVKKLLFVESKENLSKKAKSIANLLQNLDAVEIDFRTIHTFIRIIGMSPDKLSTNPGMILYEYFINYFQREQRLYREARTALLYRTEPDKLNSDLFNSAEALYKNKITRDFLTAYYFLRTVSDVKDTDIKSKKTSQEVTSNEELERLCKIEYIFTPEINHMIKDLLVMYKDKQDKLAKRMIDIYNDCRANQNIKLQIAYVLGRITSSKAKTIAVPFLLAQYEEFNKKIYLKRTADKKRKEMDIVIYRTISISLLTLGENKYEEAYIENLIYDPELNSINRGFNCAYYKDKIYNLGDKPEYKDNLESTGSIDNTMTRLLSHIEKALKEQSEKERKSLYMEIITVFSLYEVRMDDEEIQKKYRKKLLFLADTIHDSNRIYSNIVRNYVDAMRELFVKEKPYQYIFNELYNTKFEKRVGWVNRNIKDPESVMDHMYSTYLLGMFLLPETKYELEEYKLTDFADYDAYDKQAILTTVLIHDMGENYIGDKYRKSEDEIKEENNRLEYYGLLCTLPKLHGLGRNVRHWRELFSKSTINGKIANDLDKLDPLVQAYMYKVRGENIDLEEWKDDVEQNLKTTLGRKLLDFVINNILD